MLNNMRAIIKRAIKDESGSLVEELFLLPIKIMMFVAMFEIGLLLANYMIFTEAYGTCLRQAEIEGCVNKKVEDAVRNHLGAMPGTIDIDKVEIDGTRTVQKFGDTVNVSMKYEYEFRLIDNAVKALDVTIAFHPEGPTTSSNLNFKPETNP